MIVFGLIGPMASGKGTVADYLAKKYNAKKYRFSKPINDILERLGIPNSRTNQIKIGAGMRDLYGNDVWAQSLKNDILKDDPDMAVIDGVRYPEDFTTAKTLPNFILVAIDAEGDTRFARLKKRSDRPGDKSLTRDEFDEQHLSATEKNISKIMNKAEEKITNNGTFDELYAKIETIIKKYAYQER